MIYEQSAVQIGQNYLCRCLLFLFAFLFVVKTASGSIVFQKKWQKRKNVIKGTK
jgi:hypothetical protein